MCLVIVIESGLFLFLYLDFSDCSKKTKPMGNTFGSSNKQLNEGGKAGPEGGDGDDNASYYDSEEEIDQEQIEDTLMIEDEESEGSADGSASNKSKAENNGTQAEEENFIIPPVPEEVPKLDETGII